MNDDDLMDRLDDAIDTAMLMHEPRDNDSRCTCGARNNMDGDVLHGHRVGAVSDAVRRALGDMHREQRTLEDGEGGMSTNYKTGVTTVHHKLATRQSRWVTQWVTER